jgi:type VI secretion system protein ImpM
MTTQDGGAGFFGKVPSHGDFLSRRLPRSFIGPWDDWLQLGLAESRLRLGQQWLPLYLNSPAWRFALGAGVCGPAAWLGVMIPSVDRVGRYFPLTLALSFDPAGAHSPGAPGDIQAWFERLESLALSCLAPHFSLAPFDAALARTAAPARAGDAAMQGQCRFWRIDAAGRVAQALERTGLLLASDFATLLSLG